MKQSMPTGIPFVLERVENTFSHKILFDQKGWSKKCIDWLNFESYNNRFLKPDGSEYYRMMSAITGEYKFTYKAEEYSVDGFVQTGDRKWFLEFYGCR